MLSPATRNSFQPCFTPLQVMRKLEMAKSRGLTLSDEEEAFRVKIEVRIILPNGDYSIGIL